jgi:hypothetical protein
MQNVITVGRVLVPVEQIAYVEVFEPSPNGQFKPEKPYKSRVVLLNRETVLREATPQSSRKPTTFACSPKTMSRPIPTSTSGSKALCLPRTLTQASLTRPV